MTSRMKLLTLRWLSGIIFIVVLLLLYGSVVAHMLPVDRLRDAFSAAADYVVALSVSLIVFPFVSVPAVERIVSRAESVNIRVNPRLVKDYVNSCYAVFMLALTEIILIITYSLLEEPWFLLLLVLSNLVTLLLILAFLMLALWKTSLLLIEVTRKTELLRTSAG